MANMTPQEQLMLELINRARMDPEGEAKRMKIDLNEGVNAGEKISSAPKQVLAGNDSILLAANTHSEWMIRNDIFAHNEQAGTPGFYAQSPFDRMDKAGYKNFITAGENISYSGSTGSINLTKLIIEQHASLFIDQGIAGRGHRINIMNADFKEIGIGQETGVFDGFNVSMVTQDFGARANTVFITGVVYKDNVKKDNFFSVGEQKEGRAVDGGSTSDTTGMGGGYELQYSSGGTKTVDFGKGMSVDVQLKTLNVKVDLVNGDEIWTNATLKNVSAGVDEIHLLGIGKANVNGADTGQDIFANAGKNVFEGNGGADSFVFAKGTTGKTQSTADRIKDFSGSENDHIDLSPWDANTSKSGNQEFDFIGKQNFHGDAGELRYFVKAGNTFIEGDTNGDGVADLMIRLDGKINLVGGNFDL